MDNNGGYNLNSFTLSGNKVTILKIEGLGKNLLFIKN